MDLDKAIEFYEDLIQPNVFIHEILASYSSFEEWLDLAEDISDLEACLKAFEKDEMYEYCILIKNKIDTWNQQV